MDVSFTEPGDANPPIWIPACAGMTESHKNKDAYSKVSAIQA